MREEELIEAKAEAYYVALEKARKFYNSKEYRFSMTSIVLEHIFPELKESEDERIRKEILKEFKEQQDNIPYPPTPDDGARYDLLQRWMDWLEKQSDKDKLIQELGEYKVKYTQEVLEKHINSMSNKDDERLRKTTIAFLKDFADKGYENAIECIDWLEKQGEQKSEWSDENEETLNSIINDIEFLKSEAAVEQTVDILNKEIDWLKSLRPQKQWKPSEEQIYWLEWVVNKMSDTEKGNEARTYLEELLEQLKQL